MSEKPILFSDAMVRAILEGRKTQTRRVVKAPRRKIAIWDSLDTWHVDHGGTALFGPGPYVKMGWRHSSDVRVLPKGMVERRMDRVRCPYGYPEDGARLWVREAHAMIHSRTTPTPTGNILEEWEGDGEILYRATGDTVVGTDAEGWRSSIHMPRWACRLELRITRVRVERLQDISEEDALEEGTGLNRHHPVMSEVDGFELGWDEYNAKRAPWASNPWVWVLDFERAPSP